MKKLVLLFVFSLFSMSMAAKNSFRPHWKYMDEPVKITVRGIDFFIFPNGEFDFNAHQKRNKHYYSPSGYGVKIKRDRYGKIRRIGNVFINYNRYRQVSRIGNVFIKYNQKGFVYKIGKYSLKYRGRRYAIIRHRTHLNFWGSFFYGPVSSPAYVDNYPNYGEHTYNDWDEDDRWEDDNYGDSDYYFKTKKQNKKIKTKGRRK